MERKREREVKEAKLMRTFLMDIDDLHEAKSDAVARSANAHEWKRHPDYITELEQFAKKYRPRLA